MLHRGRFGLGWRHLGLAQATLSNPSITCQARIPDYFTKNLSETSPENR